MVGRSKAVAPAIKFVFPAKKNDFPFESKVAPISVISELEFKNIWIGQHSYLYLHDHKDDHKAKFRPF
jgi:hypothetical protein